MYSNDEFLAHINDSGEGQCIWQHLNGTAKRAEKFAAEFGCGKAGYFCGVFHDLGKYSAEFQKRIRNPEHFMRVDHSTAGAKELINYSVVYTPVAMAIAGHHTGLMDGGTRKIVTVGDGTFYGRMKTEIPNYSEWKNNEDLSRVFQNLEADGKSCFPSFCSESRFAMAFFIRMLYSCLVDADYLDTEAFMKQGKVNRANYDTPEVLLQYFHQYVEPWLKQMQGRGVICENRNKILEECMGKGRELPRGIYSLTVPTGGGKTTASMGFALEHIVSQQMKRVIYVIPYTSVIDQNAMVFEKILGAENVVEHHAGMIYEGEEDSCQKLLAAENWDAPVIVTTAVQFFESLFGSKSSKCRKLHNLTNSVIIFDEAQTLPVPYLEPCIAAISQLVKNYGSTVVLCTATQPALDSYFQKYLPNHHIEEICSGTERLFEIFCRTTILNLGELSVEQLKEKLGMQEQVLCIVNKRKTAQEIYESISGEGTYCLTTLLCPGDRKKKFAEIRERLRDKQPCKVIATSLIEAGVDLDFPMVFRQESGLDSLIQSAGRCNREGKESKENSMVYSFRLENESSAFAAQSVAAMKETWRRYGQVDSPEAISFYFQFYRELLGKENLDRKGIMKALETSFDGKEFPFASVAQMFRLIENDARQVYIPLEDAEDLLQEVETGKADRNTYRKLGRYVVNVYPDHFRALWNAGCLETIGNDVFVLRDKNQYREDTGLQMDVETGFGIFI